MKKLQRLFTSAVLVLTLAFGLTACGSNQSSSKSSTSKDKVSKVVKHKKTHTEKESSNVTKNNSDEEDSSSSANSSAVSNKNSSDKESSSSSEDTTSQKQLGLDEVAVWTDENGITHHVDSDGVDRQTSPNQSGVVYKDWSGPLPSNAQIVKAN